MTSMIQNTYDVILDF